MQKKPNKRRPRKWPSIFGTAEERASTGLARLEDITRLVSEWVWEADSDGRLVFVSDRVKEVLGFLPVVLVGKKFTELGSFPAEGSQSFAPDWRAPFREMQFDMPGKNGEIHHFLISGLPFYDRESWELKGFCGIAEDITKRKEIEETLRETKDRAELASRAKSEILANTSHELRTPLNAIIGFSGALKDGNFGALANEKQLEYVKDIHASGEHLLELINDILDVAAIEAGKRELHEELVEARRLANACARLIAPRAARQEVRLSIAVEAGLPPIQVDERRVKQILLNLLSNAVKFTDAAGEISLSAEIGEAGWFIFSVVDTGIGMSHSEITEALTQFGQVDSKLARKFEGTGLGLPLTRGLIELHGGVFELQSEKGVGTTAIVRFPPERVIRR